MLKSGFKGPSGAPGGRWSPGTRNQASDPAAVVTRERSPVPGHDSAPGAMELRNQAPGPAAVYPGTEPRPWARQCAGCHGAPEPGPPAGSCLPGDGAPSLGMIYSGWWEWTDIPGTGAPRGERGKEPGTSPGSRDLEKMYLQKQQAGDRLSLTRGRSTVSGYNILGMVGVDGHSGNRRFAWGTGKRARDLPRLEGLRKNVPPETTGR